MEKTKKNEIISGTIWKQLLLYFFPILLGSFFQQVYNTADTIIVGQFVGTRALAAVGSTFFFQMLVVGLFLGLSSGGTVVISQYYGAGHDENVGKAVHTSIALSLACGAAIMILGYLLAPRVLQVMNTPADVLDQAVLYTRVCFLGMIPVLTYNIGAGILRAVGDSRRPLYFLIFSSALNILLDLLFVGGFHLGVAGAALATILSQAISAVLILMLLAASKESYRFRPGEIRFHGWILKKIVQIGIPAGLQAAMYQISNVIVQRSVNGFGTDTVAAWAVYMRMDSVFWMITGALGISVTTFVGQNFGAGRIDRVKRSIKDGLVIYTVLTAAMSFLLFTGCGFIISLFTPDESVRGIGVWLMRHYCLFYIVFIFVEIYSGAMRGVGNTFIPSVLTAFGVCVLRVLWIMFVLPAHYSLLTLVMTYPVTWSATSLLFLLYYHTGRWMPDPPPL